MSVQVQLFTLPIAKVSGNTPAWLKGNIVMNALGVKQNICVIFIYILH